jgi:hypothetical protein
MLSQASRSFVELEGERERDIYINRETFGPLLRPATHLHSYSTLQTSAIHVYTLGKNDSLEICRFNSLQ